MLFLPYSLLFENLKLCQNSLRWIAKNFKKIDVEEKSCDQKIFEKQVSESEQTNESNKWANEQVSEASKWAKQVKWERCQKLEPASYLETRSFRNNKEVWPKGQKLKIFTSISLFFFKMEQFPFALIWWSVSIKKCSNFGGKIAIWLSKTLAFCHKCFLSLWPRNLF